MVITLGLMCGLAIGCNNAQVSKCNVLGGFKETDDVLTLDHLFSLLLFDGFVFPESEQGYANIK